MNEYTVNIGYRNFDATAGSLRLYSQTMKITAEDKDTAKAIAWQTILGENPYCHFESWNARLSHRK